MINVEIRIIFARINVEMRKGLLEQMKELVESFAMINVEMIIDEQEQCRNAHSISGTNVEMRHSFKKKQTNMALQKIQPRNTHRFATTNVEMCMTLQKLM